MESAPPSYQTATSNDVWLLVAPYLTSHQLCQAALVSRKWHSIFSTQLWGRPTSHFGYEYNGILDHLARFQKTLDIAQPDVRSSTFCLQLTSSEAVYFDDRPKTWLKRLLDLLPNLQALVVTGVPFFDHAACQALEQVGIEERPSQKGWSLPGSSSTDDSSRGIPRNIVQTDLSHGLRLLDASRCNNLTSVGLASALRCFVSLVYLDLSYTRASKSHVAFGAFRHTYMLKVLKLRSIQLKDDDLHQLSAAIGLRVCCLDIRDNELTEVAINALQDHCFADETETGPSLEVLEDENMYSSINAAYTNARVTHLTIEDLPERGLRQLYISGNRLNNTALSKLMNCPYLRVLDTGRLQGLPAPFLIARDVIPRLTYLRVDHAAILHDTTRLQPMTLPHLHTLVLTNVPTHSRGDYIASALIALVKSCARGSSEALSQAKSDYTVPPDQQGRASTFQRIARGIFGLRTIVLEMPTAADRAATTRNTSLTEDADSDAMWSAAATDFSFFENEQTLPTRSDVVKPSSTEPLVDNLALLSVFRNDRRIAHERAMLTSQDTAVEGYWPGTIRVDRRLEGSR